MYRIIIVDDEKLVIKSLIATVEWENYGFEVIGEAYNGYDGFELIKQKKPDLVFVDIRMPGMSGLELISESNRLGLGTLFAVVSGYAEFAYAQKALKNDAISYCLKPFSESEIVETLRIASQKLEAKKYILKIQLLMLLEESWKDDGEKLIQLLEKLGIWGSLEKGMSVAVVIEKDNVKPEYPACYTSVRLGRNRMALFLPKADIDKFFMEDIRQLYGNYVSIGISREISSTKLVKHAIDEASGAAWSYFITGKTGVVFRAGDVSGEKAEEIIKKIEKYQINQDSINLKASIDEISELIESGKITTKQVIKLYNDLRDYLPAAEIDGKDDDDIINIEQLSYVYSNAKEMISVIWDEMDKELNKTKVKIDKIKNITAKQILEFVNKNFSDDIAIRQISQKFFINPSYLSQLFKKEVGETFTKYLMKLRIQYACELLKDTSYNISEIAEKSGYADYFYFARVFKKVTGDTPSQYRNKYI